MERLRFLVPGSIDPSTSLFGPRPTRRRRRGSSGREIARVAPMCIHETRGEFVSAKNECSQLREANTTNGRGANYRPRGDDAKLNTHTLPVSVVPDELCRAARRNAWGKRRVRSNDHGKAKFGRPLHHSALPAPDYFAMHDDLARRLILESTS